VAKHARPQSTPRVGALSEVRHRLNLRSEARVIWLACGQAVGAGFWTWRVEGALQQVIGSALSWVASQPCRASRMDRAATDVKFPYGNLGAVRHRVEQVRIRARATERGTGRLPSLPGTGDVTWAARFTCFLSANVAGPSA
jgi:hypothetical protein